MWLRAELRRWQGADQGLGPGWCLAPGEGPVRKMVRKTVRGGSGSTWAMGDTLPHATHSGEDSSHLHYPPGLRLHVHWPQPQCHPVHHGDVTGLQCHRPSHSCSAPGEASGWMAEEGSWAAVSSAPLSRTHAFSWDPGTCLSGHGSPAMANSSSPHSVLQKVPS